MLCKKAASMTVGISMDQEIYPILGQVSPSSLLSKKLPEGNVWSGERLTKRQATSRPDHLWPELWRGMAWNAKLREKHKWSDEQPKLDNARRLQRICFIETEDMEFKEIIKNARRKMETPMAPAMPCKTCKKKNKVARLKISSLNLRVSWKPVNPQECVWKKLHRIIMRTILQEIGDKSLQHYNLVHTFIPVPHA